MLGRSLRAGGAAGAACLTLAASAARPAPPAEAAAATVRIPRRAEYELKVRTLVAGGVGNLAVISDFDRTITSCFVGEKRCASCYNVADGALSPDMVKYKQQIFDHYFHIEKDASMTLEEKTPFMLEWYGKSNDSLVAGGFRRDWLQCAVSGAREGGTLALRPGFEKLLITLQQADISVLIFSAGISTVITEILAQLLPHVPLAATTQVVGNEMVFDAAGVLQGWGPLIHMYNKNQSVVPPTQQRANVLLLGDGLGDVTMADGAATEPECILKVGFLNENVDGLLAQYEEKFDVVITGDANLDEVQRIVDQIIAGARM